MALAIDQGTGSSTDTTVRSGDTVRTISSEDMEEVTEQADETDSTPSELLEPENVETTTADSTTSSDGGGGGSTTSDDDGGDSGGGGDVLDFSWATSTFGLGGSSSSSSTSSDDQEEETEAPPEPECQPPREFSGMIPDCAVVVDRIQPIERYSEGLDEAKSRIDIADDRAQTEEEIQVVLRNTSGGPIAGGSHINFPFTLVYNGVDKSPVSDNFSRSDIGLDANGVIGLSKFIDVPKAADSVTVEVQLDNETITQTIDVVSGGPGPSRGSGGGGTAPPTATDGGQTQTSSTEETSTQGDDAPASQQDSSTTGPTGTSTGTTIVRLGQGSSDGMSTTTIVAILAVLGGAAYLVANRGT